MNVSYSIPSKKPTVAPSAHRRKTDDEIDSNVREYIKKTITDCQIRTTIHEYSFIFQSLDNEM